MIKIKIYKSKDGFRWRMKRKGRIIAESGEGYKREQGASRTLFKMIASIREGKFEVEE